MMRSLRARLTVSYLLVILAAMCLSGFLLLSLAERYFLGSMEEGLRLQADVTVQTLGLEGAGAATSPLMPPSAFNTVQQQSSNLSLQAENAGVLDDGPGRTASLVSTANATLQLSTRLETRIVVLDDDGAVLVDSLGTGDGQGARVAGLVAQALAGQQVVQTVGGGRGASMHLARPLLSGDRVAGVLYLSQPLRDVAAVIADLRVRWLVSTGVALVLACAIGLALSGAIARPLRRLTTAATAVARGDLEHRVPASSQDEVGNLSRAFNEMTCRLNDSRRAQLDLVANVSHELRTPLTTMKGLVETLRDGATEDLSVRDHFLEMAEAETERMIRLVNDLLILSRADAGALALNLGAVDLQQAGERALCRLKPQADARQLVLRLQASPGLPLVRADADRVQQVLSNALDNACKYSAAGGTVTVRLHACGERAVEVCIEDEGIGIPAADLSRIGERFFRADRARSREQGGTGLGLAIARALVQAQGGTLRVESEEGKGTTVAFDLPVHTA